MKFNFPESKFDKSVSMKIIDLFFVDGKPVKHVMRAETGYNGFVEYRDEVARITPCGTDIVRYTKKGNVTIKRYSLAKCAYNLICEFFSFIGSIPTRIRFKLASL